MDLHEIIQGIRANRSLPSDDDLRSLPYKRAFVYGRVSSQAQVQESHESIRDIAKLVGRAKHDGYNSGLSPEELEKWLDLIQNGSKVSRVLEDGDILVDCQDLGLSGSWGEDRRPGLAQLQRRVESGEVGAVYLTEGMSRLSRDRDRVLGYQLLKLLKQHACRIRMAGEIYNPAIARDWEYLARDIEKSAEEMKTAGIRMGNRRVEKAKDGKHVGSPVTPGYIVPIKGQNRNGSYIFDKWEVYPPHQKVVVEALTEVVKQGSLYQATLVLQARKLVFPLFPKELQYMETRSSLRQYCKDSTGYLFTYNALKGLATNLKLVGIWQWRDVLVENNHTPAVPRELFEQAYEIFSSSKPKGRAAYYEPMEWSDLLYCYNHDEPRRLASLNQSLRWCCHSTVRIGSGTYCLQIADHLLTLPLTKEVLRCLDLTPHAEAVLEKLKSELNHNNFDESQRRRREAEIKKRVSDLEKYLGSDDQEREETYWRLIREEKAKLDLLRQKPAAAEVSATDLERVKQFLENIESQWEQYPSQLRNRLLKTLIERVELRHGNYYINAIVIWKAGLRQEIRIKRPTVHSIKDKLWRNEEIALLKLLWESSSHEAILGALPGRTWASVNKKASDLKLKRPWVRTNFDTNQPEWSEQDIKCLKELYPSEASIQDIALQLGRSKGAVTRRASRLGISRSTRVQGVKVEASWEAVNVNVMQELTSRFAA